MQITEKQKQQLIDLNDSRVNEILNVIPKINKWYKYNDCILNYQGMKGNILQAYGYVPHFKWFDEPDNFGFHSEGWKEATHEEVEQALINEAKRRGFKEGVKVSREWQCVDIDIYINNDDFKLHDDNTLLLGSREIFKNGQWAEIIDDKAELKQEIKELEVKLKKLREKL